MTNSPERASWYSMHDRCNNPKADKYSRYGGRGISVCESWKVFENFVKDMGCRPSREYTLHRIENNGNYEPAQFYVVPNNDDKRHGWFIGGMKPDLDSEGVGNGLTFQWCEAICDFLNATLASSKTEKALGEKKP